jgi:YidC/Oxa1 family membrane protein insertase
MTSLLVAAIAYLDQVLGGSLGGAIIALSLGVRIALLPLSIVLARRARRNQAVARALQPELDALKAKFGGKPGRLMEEMGKVYRKHNYSPFDVPVMLGGFMQFPIFGVLYSAIRHSLKPGRAFLWIRNLSVPNLGLTFTILLMTASAAYWMPSASEHARMMFIIFQLIVTSLLVWKLAAGLGLYWAASNLVSLIQTLWLRRPAAENGVAA